MTQTQAQQLTREIPLDFNGYLPVARPAQRIRAAEIIAGDVLILDGYVSRVIGVRPINLNTGRDLRIEYPYPESSLVELLERARNVNQWPVLHITGDVNIVRFPHELVSVIRRAGEGDR